MRVKKILFEHEKPDIINKYSKQVIYKFKNPFQSMSQRFACTCGVDYKSQKNLDEHILSRHYGQQYACVCGSTYNQRGSLYRHMRNANIAENGNSHAIIYRPPPNLQQYYATFSSGPLDSIAQRDQELLDQRKADQEVERQKAIDENARRVREKEERQQKEDERQRNEEKARREEKEAAERQKREDDEKEARRIRKEREAKDRDNANAKRLSGAVRKLNFDEDSGASSIDYGPEIRMGFRAGGSSGRLGIRMCETQESSPYDTPTRHRHLDAQHREEISHMANQYGASNVRSEPDWENPNSLFSHENVQRSIDENIPSPHRKKASDYLSFLKKKK